VTLRVGLVSTFPPRRCGIAAYTRALAAALADVGGVEPIVLAEHGALRGMDGAVRVEPVFRRGEAVWPEAIPAAARAARLDVAHVQYGTDIFGVDDRLPRLCTALRAAGIPVVVTLHTVLPRATALAIFRWNVGRFYREVAAAARIVVHQQAGQMDVLERHGVSPADVVVIPHGTPFASSIDAREARRRLGIPEDVRMLLCLGFIHPLKNVHLALSALAALRGRHPTLRLVIAGVARGDAVGDRLYARWIRRRIARRGLEREVMFREEFLPEETMHALLAAADLLLLPYWEPYGSASGIVHLALASGTPMLCSRSRKFSEVGDAIGDQALLPAHRPRAWARRIEAWLGSDETLATVRVRLAAHAAATRWPRVAAETLALYRRVRLDAPRVDATRASEVAVAVQAE